MATVSSSAPSRRRSWPVWSALASVVLLLAGMIVTDLVVASRVGAHTEEMLDNAGRSVELVSDLRVQATRLAQPGLTPVELREVMRRIGADARAYDPLATFSGERQAWLELQGLLEALEADVERSSGEQNERVAEIGATVERLVAINSAAAREASRAIRGLQRRALYTDALAGVLTVALMAMIAAGLLRTAARARLLTAQRLALLDEKNQELEAFAARAAHDLRGPLSPIQGYAELLHVHRDRPADVERMAQRIRVAVTRMARVIDDMLELSTLGRPSQGESSPAAVVAEVLEEMGPQLDGVTVSLAACDEHVACPPGVLAQIVRNLVGNALKYQSPARPLRIDLRAAPVVADGRSMIELVVEDNGQGMEPELARRAFEPYHRGRGARGTPGHGLGLAIVERATHAFGGVCALESALGQGTRAIVRFPRA